MRRLDRWALTGLVFAGACGGPIATVSWDRATPRSGDVVGDEVRIQSSADGGTFPLVSFAPTIPRGDGYVVEGRIRYAGVAGRITGDSDWREFQLPFSTNGGPSPARVDINLVLPGSGTVEIGPLRVVSLGGSAWWSDRTAGLLGASAGVMIGLLGATVGVLAARRKARRFVLSTMVVLVCLGVASLVAGTVALVRHQPYAVVYPLFLLGVIGVGVFASGYRGVRRGFEEAELRKMHALDAMSTGSG
jgi:hypothetical protein